MRVRGGGGGEDKVRSCSWVRECGTCLREALPSSRETGSKGGWWWWTHLREAGALDRLVRFSFHIASCSRRDATSMMLCEISN